MDNIKSSEWFLFMVMMVHIILALFTKVEESFNVQAIHDIAYHGIDVDKYDHLEFRGVVPRTFTGPLAVSAILIPVTRIMTFIGTTKEMILMMARLILGAAVIFAFCNFARSIEKRFGRETALFLRIAAASQFHFMFYASRPLPNTFALVLVLVVYQLLLDEKYLTAVMVATFATFVFRFELVLLFGPLFLVAMLQRRLGFFEAVFVGLGTLGMSLAVTVPIDSFFWQRRVWPEGEVIWFNVVENKSSDYGTSPFWWYFFPAIPKALAASTVLIPIGMFFERRVLPFVLPILAFVMAYSFLPHKELRFVIYALPILNIPVAAFCARIWINKSKSVIRFLLAVGILAHFAANFLSTLAFLYASTGNYPGGAALSNLQFKHRYLRNKNISIHIDPFCAETGISRFGQLFDNWEYNKTENLSAEQLQRFDFLLFGNATTEPLREQLIANFSQTHKEYFTVEGFHRIAFKKYKLPLPISPPYPVFKFREKVIVLKKL